MKTRHDFLNTMNTDFEAAYHVDDSYTMDKLHFHSAYEIYFARTGGLNFFVNNRIYPVEKNDLFVFNGFDLHRIGIAPGTHYERYLVIFNPNYIAGMSTVSTDLLECYRYRSPQFTHKVHLSDEQAEQFVLLHKQASSCLNTVRYGDDVLRKLALVEILVFVNRLYRSYPVPAPECTDAGYSKIKPILAYIDEHISMKLTLDHLAQHFYINKYYLCKLFKEVTGFSFSEYVTYHRVIRASELLRRNLTVSHAAELTGFQNCCHFITTFKKLSGYTPKQFAKGKMNRPAD